MNAEGCSEESPRGLDVASSGDIDVDDLAALIDGPVDPTRPSSDLLIRLVDVPAVADRVSEWSASISQELSSGANSED
jgi:hypothetical protein